MYILGTSLWHRLDKAPIGLPVMGVDVINTEEKLSSLVDLIADKSYVEATIYKVGLSNGVELTACLGSQFEIRTRKELNWKVLKLSDIITWFPPLSDKRSCVCKQKPILEHRYELRQVLYYMPFTYYKLGFPPYWLGVFVNRGSVSCNNVASVCIEPDLALRMRHQDTWDFYLNDVPVHNGGVIGNEDLESSSTYKYVFDYREGINTDVERELKNLQVWDKAREDMFIHPSYLFSSFDQRVSLIQGIMDSSGYVDPIDKKAKARLYSRPLVENLIFLVRTIGGYAREVTNRCSTYPYVVEVHMPYPEYPFSLPRLAKLWERTGIDIPPIYIDWIRQDQEVGFLSSVSLSKSEAYIDENFLPVRPVII